MFKKGEEMIVPDVELLKEYSCLNGLVALDKQNLAHIDKLHAAMLKVQAEIPPLYT